MTAKDFKNALAADLIRDLLAPANIGATIPTALADLIRFATSNSCTDGPQTITLLRNIVNHPRRRNGILSPPIETWVQGWQLSLNYLHLLILKRFGYQGGYLDRIASRDDHHSFPVPWAPPVVVPRPAWLK
jgi:hypothetical protein